LLLLLLLMLMLLGRLCRYFKCVPLDRLVMLDDVAVQRFHTLSLHSTGLCTPVNDGFDSMLHVFLQGLLQVGNCSLQVSLIDRAH
jgi:hypothetical protein